jgi:SAM-dependent methyltransferase
MDLCASAQFHDTGSKIMTYSPYAGEMPAREKVADAHAADYLRAAERHLRFATGRLGVRRLPPGAVILDFGCGIGTSVKALLMQGYDAYGVDVDRIAQHGAAIGVIANFGDAARRSGPPSIPADQIVQRLAG